MKKLKNTEFYKLINHGPCVLVTSGNENEKNIAPIAWVTPLNDDPPMLIICVASGHKTAKLIKKYKQFVVNVPGIKHLDLIKKTGSVSGFKTDKFAEYKIKYKHGKKIETVHVAGCIGFIECRLKFAKEFDGVVLFAGSVVHCEADKQCFGKFILTDKAKTIHHIGGNNFFVSPKLISKYI